MTKIKTDIDNLFKQELAKGKAPVSDESLAVFKKRLARKSFFLFSFTHFNIYYVILGVAFVGVASYLYMNNCDNFNLNNKIPAANEIKTNTPETKTIEKKVLDTPCTQSEKKTYSPKQSDAGCTSINTVPKVETSQKEVVTSEIKTQAEALEKEPVVTALKQQAIVEQKEITTPVAQKKRVQKIDTLYANDTIKTIKKKVRIKWNK